MTIEQLQYFCAIVEHKTFTQAAIALHITLFDRSHRQFKVTDMGKQFYADARNLLKEHQMMMQHIRFHENLQNH